MDKRWLFRLSDNGSVIFRRPDGSSFDLGYTNGITIRLTLETENLINQNFGIYDTDLVFKGGQVNVLVYEMNDNLVNLLNNPNQRGKLEIQCKTFYPSTGHPNDYKKINFTFYNCKLTDISDIQARNLPSAYQLVFQCNYDKTVGKVYDITITDY